jgi:hypothetical protein
MGMPCECAKTGTRCDVPELESPVGASADQIATIGAKGSQPDKDTVGEFSVHVQHPGNLCLP